MATETGIAEVLLPKNGESEGAVVELKKHVLDELCRETEQNDQVEITKNPVMSGNHGTSEDASFLALNSDQVVSNEADQNGKVHEVLKKIGEPKSEISVEVVMDRHESIDKASGALGNKSVEKSGDVGLSEEQGRVSETLLEKEGMDTEKEKDEISPHTLKDEVKDTKKVKSEEAPAEEEEIVKTEVPENETVDLPAVRLLVELAQVVNGKNTGDSDVESHKPTKEVLEELKIAGAEKAVEEDQILEETKTVISEEEALKSRDGNYIHVDEHVEKEKEITSPKPESILDNQKEDETPNEEKTGKDEVIAEEVNEASGPINSLVKDNEIEDKSHEHNTVSTILEEINHDSSKQYTPSEIVHENAIEELDKNIIIPCETKKDVESSVSTVSAKPEDTKEVSAEEKKIEISRDEAPKSESDIKADDQTIKSEEEIIEKVTLSTTVDSTQQESSENTQDIASQLKDRDQHEVSVEEISEGEALKKSEDEVQNNEETGIIDKMFNFFSKTKDEETTRVEEEVNEEATKDEETTGVKEEVNEEATLSVTDSAQAESGKSTEDEEKSKEESTSQLKDRDQHEVSAEEKKVEISMGETLNSEGEVQNDEPLVKVEKEIVEEVTLSTTDSTQEEPSVSTQDKAHDKERSHEESASPLKERDHAEVSVEKKISEDEVQKSDDKVPIDEQPVKVEKGVVEEVTCSRDDDKSHEESATEIIRKEIENESKDQDPNEVLDDKKKIEVYTDEAPKSEGEVHNNEQAMIFEEESKEDELSTTDSTQEETSRSTQAEAHNEEKSKEASTAEIIEEESANELKENQDQTKVLVEERKFEISNEEVVKLERDVVNKDQAIKVEEETIEEVPLSTNSTTREEMSDDKQDKAQDEEKLKESTADIEEETANKLKGEDLTEVSIEEKNDEISIDEAPKSEGEVLSNEQTGLMNKMFVYFSKTESNEPITRVEDEINEEVAVSTTDSTQDKATEIIEEESVKESKDQDPAEVSAKDDKAKISKDEAPESEGEVQNTEKTGLMNEMFGYFSKQESGEVTVSTPEFQQEIKEERKTEIINEEAAEKSKDKEIKAEIWKEEIVTLETTKATESSPRDLYMEGEIKEEILNEEATEIPKDQETKAETSDEEVAKLIETPKVIESSVEASLDNREESPHEEAKPHGQVEKPVELPKDVNDNPEKIEVTTEENKTESSEKADRDIQQLKESSETGKTENTDHKTDLKKEITEVQTSERVQCKNAEDALETLVVARSDETIEEVPLSTTSTTREETSDGKQGKARDEEKPCEECTEDIIEEESADKLKGEDPTEVSAEKNKVEISKDEAPKSEGEVQSNEQPGLMNKMFGYFSKKENIEPSTIVEKEINEEVTVFTTDSTQDKAAEIIKEESANKLKDQDPTEVSVKEDKFEISKDEAPNSEVEVQNTVKTGLMNKMFGYLSNKKSAEVTVPIPESQQEKEIKEEIKTEIVNEEATEKSRDRENEAETSNEEVAQVFEAPKAIERSVDGSSEKQEESLKEDGEPQSRVEDPIHNVAEGTSSVESLKEVCGDLNKIELTIEETKIESSGIVGRDIQNLQESSETEKSENVDHTPDLEKEITEVETSEASENVQCKNTEDALETLVVAPSEVQHLKGGTLVKEDDETDLADKDIAISYKGEEEDSHQAAKEQAEVGEIHESSVLVTSKDTETEPLSEISDTEKHGQVFETPKAIECFVEASFEKREESPQEESERQGLVEDPVKSLKDVHDNPDKIEVTTEEDKTESSEKLDVNIQYLTEFSEIEKPENADQKNDMENEITEVETSESIQCKNAEDALETSVVARSDEIIEEVALSTTSVTRSDEIIEEVALSTTSVTREELSDVKKDKAQEEEKPREESTAHTIEEESADKLKGEVPTEVSTEENKVEISKDEAPKSEGEVQSNEQPGLMNKMFGYFSRKDNDEPTTIVEEEVTVFTNDYSTQDKATEIIEDKSVNKLQDQDLTEVLVKEDKVEISKDEAPESEVEVQNTEHNGLMSKMLGYFSKNESEEVTVPIPEFQQELTPCDNTEKEKEIKEEIVNEEATEKLKDQVTEDETFIEEVARVFEAPKAIERSVIATTEKQEESLKEDAKPQNRVEDRIQNVDEDTVSIELPKENKTESSEKVDTDIQNIRESSEPEKSEHVEHKPDLEKEITEVETSEASESVQCKKTEDSLETLVVAPSEVQHSTEGTLVKEDHETDLADKDSHVAAKEEAESGENLETSVLVTSKDTETEPSSETTDTEKVDEIVSDDTNKDVESSTDPIYPAEILIEERKIEDTLTTETKEKEAVKIDEPGEKLEELPRVVTLETESVENLEEIVETEKKEEKTREIDGVNDSENKAAEIIEEKCANESKDEDPTEISVDEKPKDREIEAETSNEEVVQELKPDIVESRVESSLGKQEKKDEDILTEVTETTSGGDDITEQVSREIDFSKDRKEFQEIAVPSSSLQDENVEESSKELEKEDCKPKPESLIKEEVAEEETQEGKTSLTEAKSDRDVVMEERGLETDLSGEIGSVKEVEPESEEKLECSDITHEDKSLERSVGDVEVHASAEISGKETSLKEVKKVIEEQPEIESFEAVNEEKDFPSVVNTGLLSDSAAAETASEETSSTETCLKEEKPEDEEKIKSIDIGSLSDIVSKEVESIDGEEVKSSEAKHDSVPTETYLSEAHQDHDHVKNSDSDPVDTEAVSDTTLLMEDKSTDKDLIEIHDIGSETVLPTATSSEDLGLKEPDPDAISEEVASSYDSFSGVAVSELLKEDKSTDKEPTEIHDIGPHSETVFRTATSSKDLGLKEPDPDATSEKVASSYDSASVEIPGEEEEPIKSNDTIPEMKFDSDDLVKSSDIAPVETEVQHVSEGTSSRIAKEESELPSEDVIVARDRDIDTRSNSASDEVGLKEDDKPICNEEQTGQEKEDEIAPIARLSETPVDDSSIKSGPSKEMLMESSIQEGDSKVVSNVNEETQELNQQLEIISRDTIPTHVHEDSIEEGIESAKIEESIKSEEVFEERNSSQILAEVKETSPNDLTSDSPIQEYVAEKNEESVTTVTEPKEKNESIVLEERSFGFTPETETKNTVEEVKLASDTEVTNAISPIPVVELHETSEAKEEANESSQQTPNEDITNEKPRDMEPKLDEATEGSHGVGKDELVTDRDLPVRVSAEPIRVSLEEESESEIASTVQKVEEEEEEEEESKETEILNDEKTKDSLAEETKVKEEPEESDVTEVENSGLRRSPLEEQEAGIATTVKEVKVSEEAESEVKDIVKSSHVVDEVVTDRDLDVGFSTEPIQASPSTLVAKEEAQEQDAVVSTTMIKQVSAEDFKVDSDVKVLEEAVLEVNDAVKPLCEKKETSLDEKGLAISTKEIPETQVLSVTEKEDKGEAKKIEISEGPKVIREVETEKAHSPTEKNTVTETREERDFVSDKSGSPEPKTSIEDVQFIEDHLKIATTDGKEEQSTENRQVKARDTEAPMGLEETSQRDSKPELVSQSGLVESPKEDAERKKSEHSTNQGTEEPKKKTKKKEGEKENENDDHNEEEEEEEEEEDEEDHDASTVQSSKDGETKASKKKSHGLFSGVGSKVKHSISKVKKAITGKSSNNTKEASAK